MTLIHKRHIRRRRCCCVPHLDLYYPRTNTVRSYRPTELSPLDGDGSSSLTASSFVLLYRGRIKPSRASEADGNHRQRGSTTNRYGWYLGQKTYWPSKNSQRQTEKALHPTHCTSPPPIHRPNSPLAHPTVAAETTLASEASYCKSLLDVFLSRLKCGL